MANSVASTPYAVAASGIILSHVLLPPLSYFSGERLEDGFQDIFEAIYSLTPEEWSRARFLNSLCLDTNDKFGLPYLTHMFVHGSYSHMLTNLNGALTLGLPVFREFGLEGLYIVFLGGGILASIPTFLNEDQKVELARSVGAGLTIPEKSIVPGILRNVWNKSGASRVGKLAANLMPTRVCGSSGGVCALMGCQLMLIVRDTYRLLKDASKKIDAEDASSSSPPLSRRRMNVVVWLGRVLRTAARTALAMGPYALLSNAYVMAQTLSYWNSEIRMIYPAGSRVMGSRALDRAFDLITVGHAAHIQGLTCGALFAAVFGWMLPEMQRRAMGRRFRL
jgi:membrane associated rhomboid family serine protease